MAKSAGSVIGILVWAIWIGAHQSKKLVPSALGSAGVQWSCAILVAILISVGTLIALSRLANPATRRSGFGLLIACVFPLIINLTMIGVVGPMMSRTSVILASLKDRDAEVIAKFTRQAVETESFEQRRNAARALYTIFGVRTAWRDNSGSYLIFDPSEKDQEMRLKTKETESRISANRKYLDAQLKQFPWLFALNLGTFTLIVVGGLAWHTYRVKSEHGGGANSAALHGSP